MEQPPGTQSSPSSTEPVFVVEDLRVQYDTISGAAKAVDGVSFALRAGERLGLIGESGSGKTTMATALMRLTRAPARITSGRILLEGRDVLKMTDRELRAVATARHRAGAAGGDEFAQSGDAARGPGDRRHCRPFAPHVEGRPRRPRGRTARSGGSATGRRAEIPA